MSKSIKYQCTCCGGVINPVTLKCDYCGMAYRTENENIYRIETYSNPIIRLKKKTLIDEDMLAAIGLEKASELAVKDLCRGLAENIAPFVKMTACRSIETGEQIIEGEVRIVLPRQESEG